MRILAAAVVILTNSCTAYLPTPPRPVDPSAYVGADPRLVAALTNCQATISSAFTAAKHAQRVTAWFTFAGSSVAAAGAATSTGIAVLWDGQESARATAITAAAVGLAGAIVALAARIPDGPEGAIEALSVSQREWAAGVELADSVPAAELRPGAQIYERAMVRLHACRGSK
jgi:hypothetical protein